MKPEFAVDFVAVDRQVPSGRAYVTLLTQHFFQYLGNFEFFDPLV